ARPESAAWPVCTVNVPPKGRRVVAEYALARMPPPESVEFHATTRRGSEPPRPGRMAASKYPAELSNDVPLMLTGSPPLVPANSPVPRHAVDEDEVVPARDGLGVQRVGVDLGLVHQHLASGRIQDAVPRDGAVEARDHLQPGPRVRRLVRLREVALAAYHGLR